MDGRHDLFFGFGVGDPLAVGRPCVVGEFPRRRLRNGRDFLRPDVDILEAELLVRPEDVLAVGRPVDLVLIGVAVGRQLHRRCAAILRHHPDLVLTGGIRDIGDLLAVGRPLGIPFVHPGCGRQVPGVPVFHRHGEDIAARAEQCPVAVGGDLEVGDFLAHVAKPAAADRKILPDGDHERLRRTAGEIVPVDLAAVLKDDRMIAEGRKLDVEFREVGQFLRLLRAEIVHIEVELLVLIAVRHEVNLVSCPHREDILCGVVRDVGRRLGLEIVDPDIVGLTAAISLPGAEFPEDTVVGHLGSVGGETAPAAPRQWELLGEAAVHGHLE